MKDQKAIITSVLKKLSALRVTLSDEEQAVLDTLIIQEIKEGDVSAHIAATKADFKKAVINRTNTTKSNLTKSNPNISSTATPEDDEVVAHAAMTKADARKAQSDKINLTKANSDIASTAAPQDDEVVGHAAMTKAQVEKGSAAISVTFNKEKGQYVATEK